jgi:putative resolvase
MAMAVQQAFVAEFFALQRWDRQGMFKAHRSLTNRRYYTHDQYVQYRGLVSSEQGKVIAFARVSSPSQKKDLARQKEALRAYCQEHGIKVDQWVEDIGSALNNQRKGFNPIIGDIELGHVKRLIIGYEDRFVRFGYDWFEAFCQRHGTDITVINWERISRMIKAHKIRLKPTEEQHSYFAKAAGTARFVWNWAQARVESEVRGR